MSTEFQTCVDMLKTMIIAGKLAPVIDLPSDVYLVTSSIDATFVASYNAGITIKGRGRYSTKILGTLGEAYPVIDFTGNTYGKLKDLQIDATSGSATACLLAASPSAASNAGNAIRINDCFLQMAYDASGAALVIYNSDLPVVRDSEMRGGQATTFGFGKPAAVDSKFQTLHTSDSTNGLFDNCIFLGDVGSAYEFTGGAQITLLNCYVALVGTGAGLNGIEITDASGTAGNSFYAYNLRIEDQSSAATVGILFTESGLQGGHIDGSINTDTMIKIESGKVMSRFDLNITEATNTNPLFAGTGTAIECNIKTNAIDYGTLGTASHGNTFIGELAFTEAVANDEKSLVQKDGIWYDNRNMRLYPPGESTTILRYNSSFGLTQFSTSYTGGSGEQLIGTINIPADLMTQADGSAPKVNVGIKIIGAAAAANANGRLRLVLDDGSNTQEILDHTTVPAGAGSLNIDVTIMNVSTDSLRVMVSSNIVDELITKYTNMSGSSVSVTASMDLKIYHTNDGNDGIAPLQAICSLI